GGQSAHAADDLLDRAVVEVRGVGTGQLGDVVDVELVETGVLTRGAVDAEHVSVGCLAGSVDVDHVVDLGDDLGDSCRGQCLRAGARRDTAGHLRGDDCALVIV